MKKRTGEDAFRLESSDADRTKTEQEEAKSLSLHIDNLFDQNEDFGGEKVDLATGRPIDNSTATSREIDGITARKAGQAPIGKVVEAEDAAEKWLRENDPNHPQYVEKKDKKAM